MKILVVSLLRLGDVLMIEPILKALRKKHLSSSIDILVNDNFSQKLDGVINIDKIHSFPRQLLQQDLGNPNIGIMQAFRRLNIVIEKLKSENYDYVVNLTQNKISARLISELKIPMFDGLTFDSSDQPHFSSKWFRYLNNANGESRTPQFHMLDIFFGGLGITPITEYPVNTKFNRLSIQLLTSDKKKNWSLDSWRSYIRIFRRVYPSFEIDILGAPFEQAILNDFVESCNAESLRVNAKIFTLSECLDYLKKTDLLVTGDTSIKHLAAQAPCRVIEVALGSSDPKFTGVYKKNSLIVSSKAKCAPCPHSSKCSQCYHICEEMIEPELIHLLSKAILESDYSQIKFISQEFSDSANIKIVDVDCDGFNLVPLKNSLTDSELTEDVERLMWRFYLSGEYLNPISEIGSRSHKICKRLKESGAGSFRQLREWVGHQEDAADKNYKTSCHLLHRVSFDRSSIVDTQNIQNELDELILGNCYLGIKIATNVQNMKRDYLVNSEINFKSLRLLQENLNIAKNLFEIKKKVFRTIKSEMVEMT